jgi:hypothetical protein
MATCASCDIEIDALNGSADPGLCDGCFELVAGLVVERMERGENVFANQEIFVPIFEHEEAAASSPSGQTAIRLG